VPAGKLKWWSADRGFGFILPDAGGPDMFLHFTDLMASGIDPEGIKIGVRLTFEIGSTTIGRRPSMCEWRNIGLVEHRLKAKGK
jgi:cold shock protein